MASNRFINECKNGAYCNRLGKVSVGSYQEVNNTNQFVEDELYDQNNNLVEFTIKDSCVNDGTIIGTTYKKSLDVSFLNLDKDVVLAEKIIKPSIGIDFGNSDKEYIDYDEFTIQTTTDQQTSNKNQITAYNGFISLDNEYQCTITTFPCQVKDFYSDLCSQLNLTPESLTFDNSTIPVQANPFTNHEKLRDVLSEIEKVSCTIAKINWNTKIISLGWLSDNVDYEFETSDYSTLEGGDVVYGPLNCLVLGNSQTTGENVTEQDAESIEEYGETQLYIDASYFLYTEELRTLAMPVLWNKLKGLTYTNFKLTTYYGKPFLDIGNKVRVHTNDNKVFDSYVLSYEHKYNGALTSVIEGPALTKTEEQMKNLYKNTGIKQRMARTELIVDKQNQNIQNITQVVSDVQTELEENYYTLDQTNQLIQTAQSGLTNTFSEAGGNNIFRNTGLWFETNDSNNPYEFWTGKVTKMRELKASNGNALLLMNNNLVQEQEVPNGKYTISFKYKKLIQLAEIKAYINEIELELDSLTDTEIIVVIDASSRHININFDSDTNSSCEVYDLMVNAGEVKLAYSQNQNETTTDTVNISKGITITSSSDKNTTFKADSDGIRIYNSRDMTSPTTNFTDTGMSTKKATIEDEAIIVRTLFKLIGDNTWINKI